MVCTSLHSHCYPTPLQDNVEEQPVAMCLVGNKVDLDELKEREVSAETGETFAKVSTGSSSGKPIFIS